MRQYSDPARDEPLGSPSHLPRPNPPVVQFNTLPPKLNEVQEVVRKARASAAPGPKGIPYKLFWKWLGLPRCLSEAGLFERNILQLPLQSISMGYKQRKPGL